MTDISVRDKLDIYFSAMSDLAAPISNRVWTCSPAISSYIQNDDSTAISGFLKPFVVWHDTEKHLHNGLPQWHAQIGWSAVHDTPSDICWRSGWGSGSPSFAHLCAWSTILPAFSCLLQCVDSSRCRYLCGTPACPCRHVTLVALCVSARFPESAETHLPTPGFSVPHPPRGIFVHHLVFSFPLILLLQGHLCCCSESISSFCSLQVAHKGSVSEYLHHAVS